MKKITAILFICVFAFSQYARQFNYMGCVMLNTFKTKVYKCDCEKNFSVSQLNTKQTTTPAPHLHIHLDEYFVASNFAATLQPFFCTQKSVSLLFADNICTGNLPKHWQPPSFTV